MASLSRVRLLMIFGLMALLSLSGLSTVQAAAPSITPASGTVPFGQTNITVTFDTGDGSVGQVWLRYNTTAEILIAQNPSGTIPVNYLVNSGTYTFTLYKGVYQTSPAAQGAQVLAQTVQTKVNPRGTTGADVTVVKPNPDGSAPMPSGPVSGCSGSPGGYSFGTGCQILNLSNAGPTFANPLTVDRLATYPRTVYVAFDAGSLPSGAPRPQVDVYVTAPNTPQPLLFTRNAIGIVPASFIVDGTYTFTLYDSTTHTPLMVNGGVLQTSFETFPGITSDKESYTGGANATVKVNANSDTGGPTLVCVSNSGTGAGAQFANNGTIVGYGNTGVVSVPLTGLGVNGTAYTLTVYTVMFSSGPQFIDRVSGTGQNCGTGTGSDATAPPQLANASGGTPSIALRGSATFTINP